MAILRRSTKEKLLLLMWAGISLGLTYSPRRHSWILHSIPDEMKLHTKRSLQRALKDLEREGLVRTTQQQGNEFTVSLTPHATKRLGAIELRRFARGRPKQWDNMWRLLIYDVSEERKSSRDAIRRELRAIGFVELQHSVWIFPFDVSDILRLMRELYDLKDEVIVLKTHRFEGDARFLKIFHLR